MRHHRPSLPALFAVVLLLAACRAAPPTEPTDGAAGPLESTGAPAALSSPRPLTARPAPQRLVAIGDIHGDLDAARRALRLAGAVDGDDHWNGGELVVVQTGDVIDRGDDERALLDWFEDLEVEATAAGGAFVMLNANHEVMAVDGQLSGTTPATMLWAWERPEDLRFVDPRVTGVAYLAATATLSGDEVQVRPRMQPLLVPPGAAIEAVVRVETDRHLPPALSGHQREVLAEIIAGAASAPDVRSVQVDFDATEGQREFYAALLSDVRARLPDRIGLSMTALASWCLGDPWLAELPVDTAVPMLFEMGPDGGAIRRHVADGGDFRPRVCRDAVGLATDEPISGVPRGRRTYLFHDTPWTAGALATFTAESMP